MEIVSEDVRSPALDVYKDIRSFCLRQEKSLLQGRICVPDKRNLYYRVAFVSRFTTGSHLCPGQEKSLL